MRAEWRRWLGVLLVSLLLSQHSIHASRAITATKYASSRALQPSFSFRTARSSNGGETTSSSLVKFEYALKIFSIAASSLGPSGVVFSGLL